MEKSDQSCQIFAVIQTKIEKLPYAEENDEYMPGFLRVYSESQEIEYDEKRDYTFDAWDELVAKVYRRRGVPAPQPIRPLSELFETEQSTPEGDQFLIDGADAYLNCYGLEISDVYWIRKIPVYAAFCAAPKEAEAFIEQYQGALYEPRMRPITLGVPLEDQIG